MSVFGWMVFLRPLWLLLLPIVWVLPWWLARRARPAGDWMRVVDAHLARWLGIDAVRARRKRYWLASLGGTLALLALAGPGLERLPDGSFSAQDARVIVLDLSRSMQAGDLRPDRLTRTRFVLSDLLEQAREGQLGLVAFAGDAHVVAPLTSDTRTIANLLPALRPDVIPVAGSRADIGLDYGAELLRRAGLGSGQILLVSDAVDDRAITTARELRDEGIIVSVLAVGTPAGAPIPSGGGFVTDAGGNVVIARMQREPLQRLAEAGGGVYQELAQDPVPEALWADPGLLAFERRDDALAENWKDLGPWLVLPLLPLGMLAFRRGVVFVLPLVLALGAAPTVRADDDRSGWTDAWLRDDQQVYRALQKGDAEAAARLAPRLEDDPALAADAWYRAENPSQAVNAWSRLDTPDAHYNRGNALAAMGEYEAALAAYDEALAGAPGMPDALHNRAVVEQMLEEQQQQESEPEESEGEGESSSESSEEQQPPQEEPTEPQDGESEESAEEAEQEPEQQPQPGQQDAVQNWTEEDEQAMEQWLERIPDDPGGLLRRKFRYQHQNRGAPPDETEPW
ncbi:MAG: VWA domain-containing protein [Xanthomonadales bacterium]|nr:VWA domain-containing protein [Xanthomonadales bacterium]